MSVDAEATLDYLSDAEELGYLSEEEDEGDFAERESDVAHGAGNVLAAGGSGVENVSSNGPLNVVKNKRCERVAPQKTLRPGPPHETPAVTSQPAQLASVRPFRVGVPSLPHNFAWGKRIPDARGKVFQPNRPPRSHKFADSDEPGVIFEALFRKAACIWIRGTNENGAERYGSKWIDMDEKEGWRFLSIVLTANVYRISAWKAYWETTALANFEFIRSQMSRDRFLAILRSTRLYVASEAADAGLSNKKSQSYDEIHKIRPMTECLLKDFRRNRAPDQYISIDEQMVLCQARCPFKVKMPKKPIKEGLKFFVIAESDNGYIHYADLARNEARFDDECFGRIFGLVFDMLRGGSLHDGITFFDQGFVVVTDNYYTRVELAYALLCRRTYMTGVSKINIPFGPDDLYRVTNYNLIPLKEMKRGGCRFRFSTDGRMTFAMWLDNKVVLVVSTEPDCGVEMLSVRRRNKTTLTEDKSMVVAIPLVAATYIKFMRGVDLADQKIADQMQHHRSLRWYMQVFFQLIDWAILNTGVIVRERPRGRELWSSCKLKLSVALYLAKIGARNNSIVNLPIVPTQSRQHRLIHIRMHPSLRHIPTKMYTVVDGVRKAKRGRCVVHRQATSTVYCCSACKVPLHIAPFPCWENFHYKEDYLFDDVNSRAKLYNGVCRY